MLALYEMLRVAKSGIILIEPNDPHINNTISEILFRHLKSVIRRMLGKDRGKHTYEDSGNYLFCLSRREVEKVALGLNYKTVAFKGINDAYLSGVEYEKFADKGPLQRRIRLKIRILDFLCRLGFIEYGLLTSVIFLLTHCFHSTKR